MSDVLATAVLVHRSALEQCPYLIPADGRFLDPDKQPQLYKLFEGSQEKSLLEKVEQLFSPLGQVVVSNQKLGFQAFQALAPMPDEADVVAMTNANDQWLTSSHELTTPQHLGFTFTDWNRFTAVGMMCRRGLLEAPMLTAPSPKKMRIEVTDIDDATHVVYEDDDMQPWDMLAYYKFPLTPTDKPCKSIVCVVTEWHPGARPDMETGLFRLHVYGGAAVPSAMPAIPSPHPQLIWTMEEPSLRPDVLTEPRQIPVRRGTHAEHRAPDVDLVEYFTLEACTVKASSEYARTNNVTLETATFPGKNVFNDSTGKPWVTATMLKDDEVRLDIELPPNQKARLRTMLITAVRAGNAIVTAPCDFIIWGRTKDGDDPVWIMLATVEGATTERWKEGSPDWFDGPGTIRVHPDITPACSAFALTITAWNNEGTPDNPDRRPYLNSINQIKLIGQPCADDDHQESPEELVDLEEVRQMIQEAMEQLRLKSTAPTENLAPLIEARLQDHLERIGCDLTQRWSAYKAELREAVTVQVNKHIVQHQKQREASIQSMADEMLMQPAIAVPTERVIVVDLNLDKDVMQRMTQSLPGFFDAQMGDILLVKSGGVTLPAGKQPGTVRIKKLGTKGTVKIRTADGVLLELMHQGKLTRVPLLELDQLNETLTMAFDGQMWHTF